MWSPLQGSWLPAVFGGEASVVRLSRRTGAWAPQGSRSGHEAGFRASALSHLLRRGHRPGARVARSSVCRVLKLPRAGQGKPGGDGKVWTVPTALPGKAACPPVGPSGPQALRARGGGAEPPSARGSSQPSPARRPRSAPRRTARTPVAARWSGPSVAATPSAAPAAPAAPGLAPAPGAVACRGRWAGGGEEPDHQRRLLGPGAPRRKPRARESLQDRPAARRPGPRGWAFPHPGWVPAASPPRPPFPVPTPARCGPPPGHSQPWITDPRGSGSTRSCYCWC